MAENTGVVNTFRARGRIVGMGRDDFGHPRFILFIRTDRNGRRPRVSEEDAVTRSIGVFANAFDQLITTKVPGHELKLTTNNNTAAAYVDEKQVSMREAARYIAAAARGVVPEEENQQNASQRRREREEPEGIHASLAYGNNVPEDLRIGDYVEVEGHATAYFARNMLWGDRYSYIQYLVADKVTPCQTRIKDVFGLNAGFYTGRHFLEAFLRGTVSDISESNGWKVLTLVLKNAQGRRDDSIRIQYSTRSRLNSTDIGKGDEVAVVASLVTRQKVDKVTGATRYFENLHAEDLAIVRKAASENDLDEEAENLFSALDDDEEYREVVPETSSEATEETAAAEATTEDENKSSGADSEETAPAAEPAETDDKGE